jgi:hypothetical protein
MGILQKLKDFFEPFCCLDDEEQESPKELQLDHVLVDYCKRNMQKVVMGQGEGYEDVEYRVDYNGINYVAKAQIWESSDIAERFAMAIQTNNDVLAMEAKNDANG